MEISSLKSMIFLKAVTGYRSSFLVLTEIDKHKNTFTLKQKQQDETKTNYNYNLPQIGGLNDIVFQELHQEAEILRCLLHCAFCRYQFNYALFFCFAE